MRDGSGAGGADMSDLRTGGRTARPTLNELVRYQTIRSVCGGRAHPPEWPVTGPPQPGPSGKFEGLTVWKRAERAE